MAMVDAIGCGMPGYRYANTSGISTTESGPNPRYRPQSDALRREFRRLADEWLEDILDMSSITQMVCHEAHLRIIAMGKPVLPMIFSELERSPNHWFVALKAITGSDPVLPEQEGDLFAMRAAWLQWAEKEGYT